MFSAEFEEGFLSFFKESRIYLSNHGFQMRSAVLSCKWEIQAPMKLLTTQLHQVKVQYQ